MILLQVLRSIKGVLLASSLTFLTQAADQHKAFITALPKSGTHVLSTCVELITQKSLKFVGQPLTVLKPKALKNLPDNRFLGTHAIYSAQNVGALKRNNFKGIFIIRDPRDVIVSRAYWYSKNHPTSKLSIDELLMKLINEHAQFDSYPNYVNSLHIKNLYDVYTKLYLPWQKCPFMYTTKFEDLIGPQGGGDAQKQLREIRNIARHLSVPFDDQKAQEVAHKVFDTNSKTFREGQIGSWKSHFKPMHKRAF